MSNLNNFQQFHINPTTANEIEGGRINWRNLFQSAFTFYQAEIVPTFATAENPIPQVADRPEEFTNLLVLQPETTITNENDLRG